MQSSVTENRERYIGGSDTPAIMGISPFVSRFDLLKYKAEIAENDFDGNLFTEYGNDMESVIRDHVNEITDSHFVEDKKIVDKDDDLPIRYHADGVDKDKELVLEIKTTSQTHDEVNEYTIYLVQLLLGMMVYDYMNGILAVYNRPEDMSTEFDKDRLQVFNVKIEDFLELVDDIKSNIQDFRMDLAFLKENPFADETILPSRSDLVPIAKDILALEDRISAYQLVIDKYNDLKEQLTDAMGEHNIKSWTMPNGKKVTYVPKGKDTQTVKTDADRLEKEHPDIFNEYCKKTVRKGKRAYIRISH